MEPILVREISDARCLRGVPVVSVLMLAYGHESFLAQAVEGVLAQQTSYPYELLIGEDCSPDRTREIALAYQAKFPEKIRVIFSDSNVGAFQNSRRLVAAARGKFIAFCEGDDYWTHPRKLQMQADILQANPEITLVHTDFARLIRGRISRNARELRGWPVVSGSGALTMLLRCNHVVTATTMYRATVLKDLAASDIAKPEWPFGDYAKALFAALKGQIAHVPLSTAVYRHNPGSATAQGRVADLRMQHAAHDCRETFLALSPLPAHEQHAVLVESRQRLLEVALLAGRTDLYAQHYDWLHGHGHAPNKIIHLRDRLMLRFEPLLRVVRTFRRFRREISLLTRYRRV